MVEVDADTMAAIEELMQTLRYYLAAPGLRQSIAERGFELLRQWRQSDLMRAGVEELLGAGGRYCVHGAAWP